MEKKIIKLYLKVAGSIIGLLGGVFWAAWALLVWFEGGTVDSVCIRVLMAYMCFSEVSKK